MWGRNFLHFLGREYFVWHVLQKQNSPYPDLTCNGQNKNFEANNYVKVEPILDFFFFQKRSCFFCRVTLALIKKICGGGIFFIFGKRVLCLTCLTKTKLALHKSYLLRPKQEFWSQQLSKSWTDFGFFFLSKTQCFSCRFILALIKKICGGGIFFICGERVLCFICFTRTKLAFPRSYLQRPKQEF